MVVPIGKHEIDDGVPKFRVFSCASTRIERDLSSAVCAESDTGRPGERDQPKRNSSLKSHARALIATGDAGRNKVRGYKLSEGNTAVFWGEGGRTSQPIHAMETILVKIFAVALALSQVTTTPDAVKTRFDQASDNEQVAQLLRAGCMH